VHWDDGESFIDIDSLPPASPQPPGTSQIQCLDLTASPISLNAVLSQAERQPDEAEPRRRERSVAEVTEPESSPLGDIELVPYCQVTYNGKRDEHGRVAGFTSLGELNIEGLDRVSEHVNQCLEEKLGEYQDYKIESYAVTLCPTPWKRALPRFSVKMLDAIGTRDILEKSDL
jgi:hypothetical protein